MIIHSRIHSIALKILSSSFMSFGGLIFRGGSWKPAGEGKTVTLDPALILLE